MSNIISWKELFKEKYEKETPETADEYYDYEYEIWKKNCSAFNRWGKVFRLEDKGEYKYWLAIDKNGVWWH